MTSSSAAEPPEPQDTAHPLVFHIFGFFGGAPPAQSLVLTEDDYFEYLLSRARHERQLIPGFVGERTLNTSLLFLGFQLTDWNFRVLYRMIMSQGGTSRLSELTHVAVQVDPEEDALIDPQAARKYLEKYFGTAGPGKIEIFWGSAGEFLTELNKQLASQPAIPAAPPAQPGDWAT